MPQEVVPAVVPANEIVARASARCDAEHGLNPGFCRLCWMAVVAEALQWTKGRKVDRALANEIVGFLTDIEKPLEDAQRAGLLERIRRRCAAHRGNSTGFCQQCFRSELEHVLAIENPEMNRDDVIQLVDGWILAADSPPN
ncbi:MAG: hypothetical protein A3E78_01900 [Alphaproteobacteria bacterium RIFCSPHIGHO2_12_FULL_63_12]|nr:MAG: hypothetical protein A3E78_01900 [Alphaproteobacteria bacterium RIFCSPHIGHO2_12_FULL_63_12]